MLIIENLNEEGDLSKISWFLSSFGTIEERTIEGTIELCKRNLLKTNNYDIGICEPFQVIPITGLDKSGFDRNKDEKYSTIDIKKLNKKIIEEELEHHYSVKKAFDILKNYNISTNVKLKKLLELPDEILNSTFYNQSDNKQSLIFYSYFVSSKVFYGLIRSGKININLKNNNKEENLLYLFMKDKYTYSMSIKMLMLGSEQDILHHWNPLNYIEQKYKMDHFISFGLDTIKANEMYGIPTEYHYFSNGKKEVTPFVKSLLKNPKVMRYLLEGNGKIIKKEIAIDIIKNKFKGFDKYLVESEKYINFLEDKLPSYLTKEQKYLKQLGLKENPHKEIFKQVKKDMKKDLTVLKIIVEKLKIRI